jgi:hypothetical protein
LWRSLQKCLGLGENLRWRALLHVVTAGHTFACDVDAALFPDCEDIVEIVHGAGLSPQHQEWTRDLLCQVRLVVLQVDGRGGAIEEWNRSHTDAARSRWNSTSDAA